MKPKIHKYKIGHRSIMSIRLLLLLLLFTGMASAQVVFIPDTNFKTKLISSGVDTNGDGDIQLSEALTPGYLDIGYSNIFDMTGIEAFTNVSTLICGGNQIQVLDVSSLVNLTALYCNQNQLTSLNIDGLTNLTKLDCSNNQLSTLTVDNLTGLTELHCHNNQISSLNVSNLINLTRLVCFSNHIPSLDVTALTDLEELQCGYNQISLLNVSNLTGLVSLDCSGNQLTVLNVDNLTNLQSLICANNQIELINVTALTGLKTLNCGSNQLIALDISNQVSLEDLDCNYNHITALDVSNSPNLKKLDYSRNQIPSLNLSNLTGLQFLNCFDNNITSLDLNNLTDLQYLNCGGNEITSLTVSGLVNLETLYCDSNHLSTLDTSTLSNLKILNCSSNLITSIDLSNNNNLTNLNCSINQLTSLNVTNLTSLMSLICGNNAIPDVDFSGLTHLLYLFVDSTGRTSLDVSNQPLLLNLFCAHNPIPVVDVSNLLNLKVLDCGGPALTQLFMKNGTNESTSIASSPNLTVVCADESELSFISTVLATAGAGNAVLTSYCTLVPGGNYNTIAGHSRFDLTGNGCDNSDVSSNNVRFNIADENLNIHEASLVNPSSNYAFYTGTGNFTLTPQLENPDYFNITPASAEFAFPNLDNSTQTQDFCLTANGIHPDLEVVVMPLTGARPGFDAQYQIVYKNKGNQTISGAVNLVFDDERTDLIAASPDVNSQLPNSLSWNYLNLQPFESRSIFFTLNINSSQEIPAVNSGDILNFTASINFATGDNTLADNVSTFQQKVVNSMDPNAKTCLDGETVAPDKIGNYLHYTIQFENIGTAEAINVEVKDIIDTSKFDINSLQVLYTSHPARTTIKGNVLEFIFKDINLAPLNGDPPVGGHGTILFKIKTLPTLIVGDQVENKADIYFDYNARIATNIARTTFEALSNPEFPVDKSITLYPNPTKDQVTIDCNSLIKSIDIYDIQGRILQTALLNEKTTKLDLSNKADGIYFIKITTENGVKVEKLIKE